MSEQEMIESLLDRIEDLTDGLNNLSEAIREMSTLRNAIETQAQED